MDFKVAQNEYLSGLDKRALDMKNAIVGARDKAFDSKNIFFVSPWGNDENDGRSPHKAWHTVNNLNSDAITPGSVVLFERGGVWRGGFDAREGVTYAAYGNGKKPRFYGSPFNAAKRGTWTETDVKDVYAYSEKLPHDIGCIFYDGGSLHSVKIVPEFDKNGKPIFDRTYREKFSSYKDLKRDLDFYHDFGGPFADKEEGGTLYLCSKGINPAERFNEIEFNTRGNVIRVRGNDVTFNNICVMYGGSHGIGGGTVKNLTVQNCTIGNIGGSVQFYRDGRPTRFGNGIELYGGCDNFVIDNCYVFECYDAGITHQLSSGGENDVCHYNVRYTNNLIEKCVYGIEYFLGEPSNEAKAPVLREMRNIVYDSNFIRLSGCGWGNERPDGNTQAAIKGWDHRNEAYDFVITNNIFEYSSWNLIHNGCGKDEWAPIYKNNVFIAKRNAGFARYGANPSKQYLFNGNSADSPLFSENEFVYIDAAPGEPERYEVPSPADKYQPL